MFWTVYCLGIFFRITKLTVTCYTDLIFSLNRLWVTVTTPARWSRDDEWKLNYTGYQPNQCTTPFGCIINYVKEPNSEKMDVPFAVTSDNLYYDISRTLGQLPRIDLLHKLNNSFPSFSTSAMWFSYSLNHPHHKCKIQLRTCTPWTAHLG